MAYTDSYVLILETPYSSLKGKLTSLFNNLSLSTDYVNYIYEDDITFTANSKQQTRGKRNHRGIDKYVFFEIDLNIMDEIGDSLINGVGAIDKTWVKTLPETRAMIQTLEGTLQN